MSKDRVSMAVVRRLPRYHRYLGELLANDITKVSSKDLSEKMGLTASQIRQDFNCFGGFGQQGYGYNVEILYNEIGSILGLDRIKNAILVGAGNLGRALSNHINFKRRGFQLVGIFDVSDAVIGRTINGVPVRHVSEIPQLVQETRVDMAILTVPKGETIAIVDELIGLGVTGFWNFSNMDIQRDGVCFENVHLSDSLMTLCYGMSNEP
ncbi:MAG: redox-sensing transcriptional repressor Rex [Eubacteriales bacterium]|jgi:redox-sensing transcriptional repressor